MKLMTKDRGPEQESYSNENGGLRVAGDAPRRSRARTPKPIRPAGVVRLTILADVDDLLSAIAAIDVPNGLAQIAQCGFDLAHPIPELVKIQANCDAAVRTGVLRVCFEPSDRLRDLVAGLRTGDL
jgi:hypothetical protein